MTELTILDTIQSKESFHKEVLDQKGLGLEVQDFTELNLFYGNFSKALSFYQGIRDQIQGPFALHGPFVDLKPYSFDQGIQAVSMFKYRMVLNMASLLKADYVIFHSQINPFVQNKKLWEIDRETNRKLFLDLLEEFDDFKGMILLENIYEDHPDRLIKLVDHINHPRVRVNLDIGHAGLSKKISLREWIDLLGDRIQYCHFHWNNGDLDQHRRPSEEELGDLLSILASSGLNVPLSLEYFPQDLGEDLARFKKVITERSLPYEVSW